MVKTTALLLCLGVAANAAAADCGGSGGLGFVCGPVNAEDLVSVPGSRWIIASAMAEGAPMALIDTQDKTWSALPFAAGAPSDEYRCPGAPDPKHLSTHGLNLRAGDGGHSTLYAVGHGAREAIEVFDVDATGGRPTLTWKGCVSMPDGLAANSVASLSDGSLLATVLTRPGTTFVDQLAGRPTGAVYQWSPGDDGFALIYGTELPGNNGITVSADEQTIFVVSSGLHTIVAFSRSNPATRLRSTQHLPFTPDNVHLGADGRLLTAGMIDDEPSCGGAPSPQHDLEQLSTCPRGFMGIAIDPDSMQYTVLAERPANRDFSNATIVLPVRDEFWIGTFSGDRVAYGDLQ